MNLLHLYKFAGPGSVHKNLNMSSVRVQYDGYEQQVKKTKPTNDTTISSKVVTHQQKTYFFY